MERGIDVTGPIAPAQQAAVAALEAAVETPPRSLGLPFDVWTSGRLSAYLWRRPGCASPRAGCACCCTGSASPAAGPNTPSTHLQDPAEVAACEEALRVAGEKGGGRSRSGTNCTMRTRPTSTPTRT